MSNETVSEHSEFSKLSFDRIVFFSDAIFAIVITLLVIEIRPPEIEALTNAEVIDAIMGVVPAISVCLLSFAVLGTYWILHHRVFKWITGYDYRLVTLNLLFMLTTIFVPVTTSFLGHFANFPAASIFYALSIGVMGLAEFAVWAYAAHKRRFIRDDIPAGLMRYVTYRILIPPAVFLLSMPIAAINANLMELSWALMIPAFLLLRFAFPQEHRLRQQM